MTSCEFDVLVRIFGWLGLGLIGSTLPMRRLDRQDMLLGNASDMITWGSLVMCGPMPAMFVLALSAIEWRDYAVLQSLKSAALYAWRPIPRLARLLYDVWRWSILGHKWPSKQAVKPESPWVIGWRHDNGYIEGWLDKYCNAKALCSAKLFVSLADARHVATVESTKWLAHTCVVMSWKQAEQLESERQKTKKSNEGP